MKKMILMFMILFVLPFVFAVNTDFSQHYLQSEGSWLVNTGGTGFSTDNSYLLRATTPETDMNYQLSTWDSCSVTNGGSEFGATPITIEDVPTDFKHRSLIVTYSNSIKQYGADCSVEDKIGRAHV